MNKVLCYVKQGWPSKIDALRPYWRRRDELTLEGNCVLLGNRVVIPVKLQEAVFKELHCGHPGVVRA